MAKAKVKTNKEKYMQPILNKITPTERKKFGTLVEGLMASLRVVEPADVMLVNRMATCWLRMKRVEDFLSKYPMFFEQRTSDGTLKGVKTNEGLILLRQYEKDFQSYYRILKQKYRDLPEDKNFEDYLNDEDE